MVKKKGKSKRTTLKDKYKIQKRTLETHRKRRKQAKQDAKAGIVKHDKKKKDPGIPNTWPFKKDLLKEIQRQREQQEMIKERTKEERQTNLRALREHQAQGGTARTVQELMAQANKDQAEFHAKNEQEEAVVETKSDGSVAAGQQSRRAYLKDLKKVIDSADVLLQILDARDPLGSRVGQYVEDMILSHHDKRMVLVLNKIDLVPKEIVGPWLTYLRKFHPTLAVNASAGMNNREKAQDEDDESVASTTAAPVMGMEGLLQLLKNYARTGGSDKKSKSTIVVGCIGLPNVGKSSIINALKRTRAVGVSARPGFTTSLQEVVLDQTVRLIDSPGVVFDDNSAMLGNCVDAMSIKDPVPAVEALLQRCDHKSLLLTYNLPAFPPGDVTVFLGMIAKHYGKLGKRGIPDKESAARKVLIDWNTGKIRYFTAPPKDEVGQVQIVSKFASEFDVEKYDESVMSTLNSNKDAMDYLQLEAAPRSATIQEEGSESEEEEMDEESSEEDDDDDDKRMKLDD